MFFHDEDRKRAYEINDRAYKSAKALDLALEKLDKLIEDQLHMSEQLESLESTVDESINSADRKYEFLNKMIENSKPFKDFQLNEMGKSLKKRGRPKNVGS